MDLIHQAYRAVAEAASLLRDSAQSDELAYAAMRLEAELGMLEVRIRKARSTGLGSVAAAG